MASVDILSLMKSGSGIDIQNLAKDLVEAERAPRKEIIDKKIAATEARISSLSVVKYNLQLIQSKFQALDSTDELKSIAVSFTESGVLSATASNSTANEGAYRVNVTQLASSQVSSSTGFGSKTYTLNNGNSFTLNVATDAGESINIDIENNNDTPQGIVAAINASSELSALGVSAVLVDTGLDGVPYKIVVTGSAGADSAFTLSSSDFVGNDGATDFSGIFTTTVSAVDANLTLNGVSVTRPSNTIDDLIDGVTLKLSGTSVSTGTLNLTRDTSSIKTRLQDLVTTYNDFMGALNIMSDRGSTVEIYGGSLAGDSIIRTLKGILRGFISEASSAAGDTVKSGLDIGLEFDRYGTLFFNESTFDSAVEGHFSEVVTMLTGDLDDVTQSVYADGAKGLAGDAAATLNDYIKFNGLITDLSARADNQKTGYQKQIDILEERMTKLLDRYNKIFSQMDSLVSNSNSTRTGNQNSFDGMLKSLNN
jgi:flagellar hook-associated protein 2